MTLIRGPSEEQGAEEGAVGWAMQGQSGHFVYSMMQLLVVLNDLHRAPGNSGTHEWSICHLCVSMGVQFLYCFPLRSNM